MNRRRSFVPLVASGTQHGLWPSSSQLINMHLKSAANKNEKALSPLAINIINSVVIQRAVSVAAATLLNALARKIPQT